MLSLFRPARIYFHQIFNTRRQLCAFTLTIPIQSNVNHEVTRKLSTSKPLSIEIYSAHSKKKLLSAANRRHLISQFYTLQSFFSSSSGSRKFDESRTLMVAGLSRDTTEVALCVCFSKKWEVTKCSIVRDKKTGNSRKFGFVEFLTAEQAKHALEFDHFIDRKQIPVQMSGNKELHDKYRIFVGGLLTETSGATLHKHFSQFGDIFDCSIVRKENNLSRGFGYVTYKSQESVDRALNSQPHSIDNKEVYVNQAYSRQRELTLFIGNLSPKTTDESLREHFSKYGQLTECEVKTDRQTGQSRGFGYVAFASQEELNRALNEQTHMIDDVEVKLGNRSSELDLMVNSLPRNIGEESLKKLLLDLFSGYGQVRDCRLIKNSAGGITAFVSMSSRDEISRALAGRPHWIDGKLVDTHLKDEQFSLRLFDIPKDATDEDLYKTFSKVGNLVHWQVKRDWKNNRPLGYAYVSFSSAEDVDRVMERQYEIPYSINGTQLIIRRKFWDEEKKQ